VTAPFRASTFQIHAGGYGDGCECQDISLEYRVCSQRRRAANPARRLGKIDDARELLQIDLDRFPNLGPTTAVAKKALQR